MNLLEWYSYFIVRSTRIKIGPKILKNDKTHNVGFIISENVLV